MPPLQNIKSYNNSIFIIYIVNKSICAVYNKCRHYRKFKRGTIQKRFSSVNLTSLSGTPTILKWYFLLRLTNHLFAYVLICSQGLLSGLEIDLKKDYFSVHICMKMNWLINVFHFLWRTRTSLSFTWWYTQPPAPHATPTSGKRLWQDSPVASPPNVGLQLEGFFFSWNTWRSPMQPRGPWPNGRLANAWRARVVASNPRPHRSEQVSIQ